jgi:hypothetical protein
MEISGSADRFWEDNACGIDCLPCFSEITSSCDLFDQNRCEAFAAELLVDGEEVDLRGVEDLLSDS